MQVTSEVVEFIDFLKGEIDRSIDEVKELWTKGAFPERDDEMRALGGIWSMRALKEELTKIVKREHEEFQEDE